MKINKLLLSMQKSLENAIPVYKSLKQYENFIGTLPILFFELAHKNGDIKSSVDALSKILIENQNSKKKITQALRYPMFLTITLLISVGIIFNFVIPQFEHIFSQYGGNLPQATVALLYVKNFFDKYFYIFLILLIPFAILMKYLYYKYSSFFDKIIVLHLPFFSKLYQHFIFYRFFLSLSMLVKSNYKFQVALKSTTLIINNHFILYKLNQIISIIENGSSISNAFNQANLVDNLTIRLLHTAQETNALPKILINLTSIYKQRLDDGIEHFTSAINPVFILLLSVFVLWIVLAIMLPTLNIGEVLN
jgi:type II secretory pathway component PulF